MKKLLFIAIILSGCVDSSMVRNVRKLPKKPYIVVYKYPLLNGIASYEYADANGEVFPFCEREDKYSIGDTIK